MSIRIPSKKQLADTGLHTWLAPPIAVPILLGTMILAYALSGVTV